MAVGLPAKVSYANGDVFSASDINDTNGTINLIGQTNNFYAGKNKIINGNFGIWQRGTSFTVTATPTYTSDRWFTDRNGTGATVAVSQQTFTPATAPVSGYEGTYFLRVNQSVAGSGGTYNVLAQKIEDVRVFAGQTATFSFWAKASSTITLPSLEIYQDFGSGGSGGVQTSVATSVSIGTSWTRYSYSVSIPSISGKTIGTGSNNRYTIYLPINSTFTFDIWGAQLESGSAVTAFQTATGTVQGELAACLRYFWQIATGSGTTFALASAEAANTPLTFLQSPVTMRIAPSLVQATGTAYYVIRSTAGINSFSTFITDNNTVNGITIYSNPATITAGNAGRFITNNASSSLALNAEL